MGGAMSWWPASAVEGGLVKASSTAGADPEGYLQPGGGTPSYPSVLPAPSVTKLKFYHYANCKGYI